MRQVTIDLEDEIEKKLSAAAKSEHLSQSDWVARLIKAELASEWPESIARLAGAWKDLPLTEEGRQNPGQDAQTRGALMYLTEADKM